MSTIKKIFKGFIFFFISLVIGTSVVYIITEKKEAKEEEVQ